MDTIPDTIDKWIAKAEHFHIQNQCIKVLQNRSTYPRPPTSSTSTPNPDAMDIDSVRLTPVKWAEYMKKGLCFVCRKQGHRSTNHKNGRLPQKTSSPQPTPIKTVETPTKTPSSVEKFISELQKNSETEMLDVLKVLH
ncbi:hypothetical protein BS17DRAFT_818074 [Gyrodon lividus]|nr:hypothetical protein BS17DRAFT_818074 [Gyrodon lividus]